MRTTWRTLERTFCRSPNPCEFHCIVNRSLFSSINCRFIELYINQLLSPLAMFQFFTSVLWLLDQYWQYTIFSIINVLIFESTAVFQQVKTRGALRGMSTKPAPVYVRFNKQHFFWHSLTLQQVYRGRKWCVISTEDILPGDIISLKCHKPAEADKSSDKSKSGAKDEKDKEVMSSIVPCDCLLLKGAAVVNESSLTGESVPQMKDAVRGELIHKCH